MNNPTNATYTLLDKAFQFFNDELFMGHLPPCLITMQRKGKARGFFCPERFETRSQDAAHIHEIALNPAHFKDRSDLEILSTLAHEMVHLWQQENGTAPRRNYHNKEWAGMMEQIGLMASNTGEPGGRKTGQSVSHFVIDNGKYKEAAERFLKENDSLHYEDRPEIKISRAKSKNKIKYTCPDCDLKAWGKPGANLWCGDHQKQMEAEEL